jgi:hypothetical protein
MNCFRPVTHWHELETQDIIQQLQELEVQDYTVSNFTRLLRRVIAIFRTARFTQVRSRQQCLGWQECDGEVKDL